MVSKIYSASLVGLDPRIVEVEVDITRGKNMINIVGLPDKSVSEAKERIIPAMKNSNCFFPKGKITINLAPADLPKTGSMFDLAIVVGILIESGQIKFNPKDKIIIGELSLEGITRESFGIISIIDGARKMGYKEFFIPKENSSEAVLIEKVASFPIHSLNDFISHTKGNYISKPTVLKPKNVVATNHKYDLKYVKGQEQSRRVLEIAAAGSHNCIFVGVPGSGKTFLSRCIPTILPTMTFEESLEVTRIYSTIGQLGKNKSLMQERPFRSPHHTTSQVALVGGGTFPRPGEITLAHRGVLFLDEFAEFPSKSLEALRQPMEDRIVHISRATGTLTFPADFMLIAAMNPCKCGYFGDPDKECVCTPNEYLKYQRKISGPIMDRIDLQVKVPKVRFNKISEDSFSESSQEVQIRVEKAREIQKLRFINQEIVSNSSMGQSDIKKYINLNRSSLELMKTAIDSLNLTARGYYRVLKVARTIADLDQKETVTREHIAEALSFRM